MAYDTSFAKSKVPFASTIATFRRRSFKPAVVVLHKNFHMRFSGDAHIIPQINPCKEFSLNYSSYGRQRAYASQQANWGKQSLKASLRVSGGWFSGNFRL